MHAFSFIYLSLYVPTDIENNISLSFSAYYLSLSLWLLCYSCMVSRATKFFSQPCLLPPLQPQLQQFLLPPLPLFTSPPFPLLFLSNSQMIIFVSRVNKFLLRLKGSTFFLSWNLLSLLHSFSLSLPLSVFFFFFTSNKIICLLLGSLPSCPPLCSHKWLGYALLILSRTS